MTSLLKFSALATLLCFSVARAAGPGAPRGPGIPGGPGGPGGGAATIEADRKAVGTACKKDAEKIGCKMTMGDGMGRCMLEYKKGHPDWNPSDPCKVAGKKLRQDNMGNRAGGPGMQRPGMAGAGMTAMPAKPMAPPPPTGKPAPPAAPAATPPAPKK